MEVNGTGFNTSSVVQWNEFNRPTAYASVNQLWAAITAADIATGGTFPITVFNPGPDGGTSNVVNFTVNNPLPIITTLSPMSATPGGGGFTLVVNGTGFNISSVVQLNGSNRATAYVSVNQLWAMITTADIATGGTCPITVFNPTPGGGTSNTVNFTVLWQIFFPIINR